ncbi:unnamed protein product [Rhizopus stolonifer]
MKGKIVVTEPFGENATIATRVNSEITCISTITYNNVDYAAIGYSNGLIFIEEITEDLNMKTIFQIASDNDSIQSIDWQKKPPEGQWPLLAFSTKRLRNIFIYDIPSQKKRTSVKIPYPPSIATEQQKASIWIETSWSPLHESRLYLTGYLGLIFAVDITPNGPQTLNGERLEKHNRIAFSINWFNGGKNCITTSLDKQIIKWDMNKKKPMQTMRTQSAYPYALDISPTNINQLVIGMGDNNIKLWDFQKGESVMPSKNRHNYYTSTLLWRKLYSKIMLVKCHPFKEGVVAYADDIGRFGVYNTTNQQSEPFKTHQNSKECSLIAWGPDMSTALNDANMVDTLISCKKNGLILVHDSQNPESNPIVLNGFLEQKNPSWTDSLQFKNGFCRTSMAVNRDLIAFGHMDGVVEVYSLNTFQLVYVSTCHRKAITAMDWKGNYLATGCEQGLIVIHDLTNRTKNIPATIIPEIEAFKSMKKHTMAITVLKWTREPNVYIIASGSNDNLVYVWDMDKLISMFDQHRNTVLSICWHYSDPKKLFSSSADRFIYDWSYSDYKASEADCYKPILFEREKIEMEKQNEKGGKRPAPSNTRQNELKKSKKSKTAKTAKTTRASFAMMNESELSENTTSQINKAKKCLRLANVIFEGKIEATVEELKRRELTDMERDDPNTLGYLNIFESDEKNTIYEHIFGDKEDVFNLVEIEEKSIQTQTGTAAIDGEMLDRFDKQLSMNLMLSQTNTLFNENDDGITDWIVLAMSPQAGKSAWIDSMKKQGKKMEKAGKYHLAVSCYIAISHIYKAIEVYQSQNMFREAIALTKLRVPEDKQLLSDLFLNWASYLQTKEDYELTAVCFILSEAKGSVSNAINLLSKTNTEEGLFYAACLSHVIDDGDTTQQRITQWKNKLNERFNKNELR